jgi:aldehyde:ferredoxin oxidoreductase
MPLLMMTGPLVGTASPTSGRMCIMSRSPLTGTIGDCSVGGSLGTHMKRAGWDGIVISGQSRQWVGITIHDSRIAIVPAGHLQGLRTTRVIRALPTSGARVAIGPAAENGVHFANIMVDGHFAAGRNGLGAGMAAKKLKYLTVEGSGSVPVSDRLKLQTARKDINRLINASPVLMGAFGLHRLGTGALYDLMANRHMMPTANFRATVFDAAAGMNANAYQGRYQPHKAGCRGCHIRCKQRATDGRALPEFETMSHFSALLENERIEVVMQANAICNELGMDTISTAATIACYAEASGRRLSGKQILALVEAIGHGSGIGRELGKGSARWSQAKHQANLSMSVKGQELPAYDPRGAYGMALAYATSTRGACHLRAYPIAHEILRKPVATDRFTFEGKARIIKIAEDTHAVVDSLTACKFVFLGASLEEYAQVLEGVTGQAHSAQTLLQIGERIYYHERIMNACNGFDVIHDDLPPRFFSRPGSRRDGLQIGPLDRDGFLQTRFNYYRIRGLTKQGMPTVNKAQALGLQWNPSFSNTHPK